MDHAVVVGISRYPGLTADGVVADLEGPDADAQAVHDWLVDADGAGLDPALVRLVRSAQFAAHDPTDPQPASARVEAELRSVEEATRGRPGGRLYLYFAGHGFSPVLEEGALFTADATLVSPAYVYAHAWLRWFRTAQRFRESVLWMDACMTTQQSIPVRDVLLRPELGTGVPGPAFVALAAQTKSALERRMPDGRVHGVFTWALLQGLRGGAANDRGQVTGRSLRAFLHNALPELLPEAAHRSSAVDLQPFVRADEGMVFRRLPRRPRHEVRMSVPGAEAGQTLRVWAGRPAVPVVSEVLVEPSWRGQLVRGLYVVDVPEAGLRQGFQVTGTGPVSVVVEESGPPGVACDGSELFVLRVRAANAAASLAVVDASFERTFSGTGGLDEREAPGVYKLRVQHGRNATTVVEKVVLLDGDLDVSADQLQPARPSLVLPTQALPPASRVPAAPGTRPVPRSAVRGSRTDLATLWLTLRAARAEAGTVAGPTVRAGLELRDSEGQPVGQPFEDLDPESGRDDAPVWTRTVVPGVGALRLTLPHRTYEGAVVACAGWTTQLVLLQRPVSLPGLPDSGDVAPLAEVAVFLRRTGSVSDPDDDAVLEVARLALAGGRDLLGGGRGERLQEVLLGDRAEPVSRLIGAHLLLRATSGNPSSDPDRAAVFDHTVAELRAQVGRLPDVEALSLRCRDASLRTDGPIDDPPLLAASWQLMAEASYDWTELVPDRLWQRVHAWTRFGTWFVWAVDDPTRAAHSAQLSAWIAGYCEDGRTAADEAGRRLLVPAAAVADLWDRVCE